MLEALLKPHAQLTTVTGDTTLAEALSILEENNFQAIPILDSSGKLFRGAVYKLDLYQQKANQEDMQRPVTSVMCNTTKFIHITDSFFDLTFTLRDLPFISVLDQQNHFLGIITNADFLQLLEKSWKPDDSNYALTIIADGERGSLERAAKIMSRYTNLLSVVTVNPTEYLSSGRILVTLPAKLNHRVAEKMVKSLERKGFIVENTERLY